ncbi:AAA family ATPase [Desulfovibrio subterraneus]|uniref:ATPase AAA-type core domain-containing protein n=1 Tax=Desulfovibrio subterraneus TaxID=2718620 RepID=A0A7J0BK92_9BACT|nr:ATP-binding protein [Desulfovibrio subterraneus]GFM34059.1 hypothetical protein DSM101010T_24240 [Desulfovibrio subterraneus]
MITSIRLINWKSFADAKLYIDPITTIIGVNASGKSNILDALEFLRRTSSGVSIDSALSGSGDGGLPPLRGNIGWAARKGHNIFGIEAEIETDNNNFIYSISVYTKEKVVRIHEETLYDTTAKTNVFKLKSISGKIKLFMLGAELGDADFENESALSTLHKTKGLLTPKEYIKSINTIQSLLSSIFPFKPMHNSMRSIAPISDQYRYDGSNIAGFIAGHKNKTNIERQLSKYATKFPEGDITKVWTEFIGINKEKAELYCNESFGNTTNTVDANNMSDGTLRFLAILVAMLTAPEHSLVAIEEIDNGLHPSRSELLINSLKEIGSKRKVDVIIITHNPALLNFLGPEAIPFISVVHRKHSGESTITLLEDVDQLPKLMASGPIGTIVSQGKLQKALRNQEDAR